MATISNRPELQSPTPMPRQGISQKAKTPPAIRSWPKCIKGWRNQAPAPAQVDALTAPALARIRETARLPRRGRGGNMESTAMAQARGAVDLAIVGVMSDGGLRRSEAAALIWTDVEYYPDGTARITIQKGKNQPEPATVAVTETTARALREIQPRMGPNPQLRGSGVRPDRRGPGQPGEGRRQRRRPGRRLLRTQRPHRNGPAYGRRRSAKRCGPAPGAVAPRRYGGPVHRGEAAGEALKWLS